MSHRSEVTGVEPMVVVGVGPSHTDLYDTAQRHRDFTPGPPLLAEDAGRFEAGGADAFRSFLLEAVIPLAGERAAIDPARTSLMGHSLAGYFALDVLTRRPDAFAAYAAISPSIWWNPARLSQAVADLGPTSARVLLAVGRREQGGDDADTRRTLARQAGEGAGFPDEDHVSVVTAAAVRALRLASAVV